MFNDNEYDSFVAYLRDDLKESKFVHGLEFLDSYCQELPPISFDIGEQDEDSTFYIEEVGRNVRDIIGEVNSTLRDNENEWLRIENGEWSLLEDQVKVINKNLSQLEQKLSTHELSLLSLPVKKINEDRREEIEQLYKEKVVTYGTNIEQYKIITRLAESYELKKGDDTNYIDCLLSAGSIGRCLTNKDSYSYYECISKYYRSRYEHDRAAFHYQIAIDTARECKEHNDIVISLIKNMRIQYQLDSNESEASKAFIEENKEKIKNSDKKRVKVTLYILGILSDYCQNPRKVAAWALVLILVSTIFYALVGITPSVEDAKAQTIFTDNINILRVFMDSLYFSIVTFSTLGYGDYSPSNGFSRVMANIEALGGLFFSSLFLVTLVRKYGR